MSASASPVTSATTTLSDSSSDSIAPNKSKKSSGKSSRSSSPKPQADGAPETTKKKSRSMFKKVFHTIGGGSRKKTDGSTSSSDNLAATPVDSSLIPVLSSTPAFNDKTLAEMLSQIQIAAVYLKLKQDHCPSSSGTVGDVTPRHFKADVIDVRAQQTNLTGKAAIEDSVKTLIQMNANLKLPNWIDPLTKDEILLKQISEHDTIETITDSEKDYLETLYGTLSAQDREALVPLSEDSSGSSSS